MANFLVIDDQATSRKLVSRLVSQLENDAQVFEFYDAAEALEWAKNNEVDLVLVDYSMPGMNGVEFTTGFRRLLHHRDVPVVVITINEDADVRLDALEAGATDFLNKPVDHFELRARCQNLLTLRRHQENIKRRAQWLEEQVSEAVAEIEVRELDTLSRLYRSGRQREVFDQWHCERITRIALLLAEQLGMSPAELEILEYVAPLHDIGKTGITDLLLHKAEDLNDGEIEDLRAHSQLGYELLKDSPSRFLKVGAQIALSHHEKYDGSGYPNGVAGEEIPLPARIMAVVDVLDALLSDRAYRPAWPLQKALDYIKDMSEKHFDPGCVEALLATSKEIAQIYRELSASESRSANAVNG